LELAVQHSIRTIAFPTIGIGALGFPVERAAEVAFQATSRFLLSNTTIGTIIFVCFDEQTRQHFDAEFWKIAGW
jgi:O-acetyl-ADP-ribose deacetylase (regulator of RNase III)